MNAQYQNGRGIVVYVPPISTQYPTRHPGLFDEVDIIIPRTFILAVGTRRKTGFFFNTPGIERAIREKQLPDATFAYVNVEMRLHPREGKLIPTVTRENIHFTKENYADALGRETLKRLIGKRINKEVRRIISTMIQRHHQLQQRKIEVKRNLKKEKWKKIRPQKEPNVFNEKKGSGIRTKMARVRRAVMVKTASRRRVLAWRHRKGARKI